MLSLTRKERKYCPRERGVIAFAPGNANLGTLLAKSALSGISASWEREVGGDSAGRSTDNTSRGEQRRNGNLEELGNHDGWCKGGRLIRHWLVTKTFGGLLYASCIEAP